MTNLPTDILMQLVRARYACLMLLRDLGRRQLATIEAGQVTLLLDLLSAKQKPLSDIQRIEKAMDPYRDQDPEKRPWRSPDDRAACARLVEQCDALLREIVTVEKQCEEMMVEKRDAAAARLQQLRTAGQAHGAYAAPDRQAISQLDVSSER